jgi:hypothetical protein
MGEDPGLPMRRTGLHETGAGNVAVNNLPEKTMIH